MAELESARPFVIAPLRVRYAETDQMGVAHHACYLVWFEHARTEFCRSHGIDYRAVEADGRYMPVVEARVRYRLAARYDDPLEIRAEVKEATRRTLRFRYLVTRGTELLAEGETLQLLIDSEGRSRIFPPDLISRFSGNCSQSEPTPGFQSICEEDSGPQ